VRVSKSHEDDVVHPPLARKSGGSDVRSDMVIEGVVLHCQHDKVTPAGVVGGDVKEDGD
jgi:hypothetical protein